MVLPCQLNIAFHNAIAILLISVNVSHSSMNIIIELKEIHFISLIRVKYAVLCEAKIKKNIIIFL
jgi:hypothetical protein